MSLSLWISKNNYEIGNSSFLKSFFSTVYIRLENEDWGSLFPIVMNDLYMGNLHYMKCDLATEELNRIRESFKKLSPDQIVWDFEKLDNDPPWGGDINPSIDSLANYFWTSNGKNLFEVFLYAFREAKMRKTNLVIR